MKEEFHVKQQRKKEKRSCRTQAQLLQQVHGSITHLEPLSERNLPWVAEEGLSLKGIRQVVTDVGLDADKIMAGPSRQIYNAFYVDYEKGLYITRFFLRRSFTTYCSVRAHLCISSGSSRTI